jgi:hypothetical protein
LIRFLRSTLLVFMLLALAVAPLSQAAGPGNGPLFIQMNVTAYTLNENLTALGTLPREGVAASNYLPLGTVVCVTVPQFIDRGYFTIEDRMNDDYALYPDNERGLDIWTRNPEWAKQFGRNPNVCVQIIKLGSGRRAERCK